MSDKPTLRVRIVAVLTGIVLACAAGEGVLRIVMPNWHEFYAGWFMRKTVVPGHGVVITGRPGFDGYFAQKNGDFRVRVTINDFGLRNLDPAEAAGRRIWIIGDSIAFGWGVERDEMYSSVIARTLNTPTYNVAGPGTDVCGYQALLARMPENVKPRAVIVSLVVENDLHAYDCRAAARQQKDTATTGPAEGVTPNSRSSVKALLTRYSALYNFVAAGLKSIDVLQEALTAIRHAYRRVIADDKTDAAVDKTADELAALRAMLPKDTPFAVLIVPARTEIKDGDAFYRRLRLQTNAALTSRGIAVIDPYDRFAAAGFGPTHLAHDGHWSALGHRLAGEAVALWLAPM